MEETKKFVRAKFCQFIEEEQKRLGLSDHDKVGDYEIGFLKEKGTALPALIFNRTMTQFSPNFGEWFIDFSHQLTQFKQNKEERKND